MMNLAIWLKKNRFRADQVQTFYPSPMATATAMYHTGLNPLKGLHRDDRDEKAWTWCAAKAPPPAQGLSALPRPQQLAALARGPQGHGPRRPDRQRQAVEPGINCAQTAPGARPVKAAVLRSASWSNTVSCSGLGCGIKPHRHGWCVVLRRHLAILKGH